LLKGAVLFVACAALLYALLAGLHTVSDPDLGWQLATGRWIVLHHSIPATDVLSHTAHGQEWLYPVLSQLLLYMAYAAGGYALLSWIGAMACAGTVAILMRQGKTPTFVLALLAVPLIAERTIPRAEMFTEIFFAAFVSILWHYHRSGRGPLYLLPVLMCLWANMHPGFIAGFAMCGAYVLLEVGEGILGGGWQQPVQRLRRAWPWILASVATTLLNPFGTRLFLTILRQSDVGQSHSRWISEWMPMRFTSSTLAEAFAWREPTSAMMWMLAAGVLIALLALLMRRIVPALMLVSAVYLAAHAIRFRAPFATIVVVIGGSILADAAVELKWMRRLKARVTPAVSLCLVGAITLLAGVRMMDLVSDRTYMSSRPNVCFGAGESPIFPEGAASFVLREHLPPNLFNDYNSGGFLAWRLGPEYGDYIDGRAIPFGAQLFLKSRYMLEAPLDSDLWRQEANERNLNTAIVSVDATLGAGALAALKGSCTSHEWRPVYLDSEAAVFVRVRPETESLIERLQVNCDTVRFDNPPAVRGIRGRAERFQYHLNAAAVLLMLARPQDALESARKAESIFEENKTLHYVKGAALLYTGQLNEGEQELRRAVELGSMDSALFLATYYQQQGRLGDQTAALERAADLSDFPPYSIYLRLGYAQLAQGRPERALASFDRAEKETPQVEETELSGTGFWQNLETGRAAARRMEMK
jgi:tetratricopeptide (TPR) repeat protein